MRHPGTRSRAIAVIVPAVLALAALTVLGLRTGPAAAAPAATPTTTGTPRLVVTPDVTTVGSQVLVDAEGLAPDTAFDVQLCGNGGRSGSVACDLADAFTAVTSEAGHFAQYLTIGTPPVPCPCVVTATSPTVARPATAPVTVTGLPVAPVTPSSPATEPNIDVTSATLSGTGSLAAAFGASSTRQLELTLHNAGTTGVTLPPLVVVTGPASNPNTAQLVPPLGTLGPGATRRFDITVQLPPLARGTYAVDGHLAGLPTTSFTTTVELVPWGLLVVGGVAVVLLVVGLARWWHRHRKRRSTPTDGPRAAPPGPPNDPFTRADTGGRPPPRPVPSLEMPGEPRTA